MEPSSAPPGRSSCRAGAPSAMRVNRPHAGSEGDGRSVFVPSVLVDTTQEPARAGEGSREPTHRREAELGLNCGHEQVAVQGPTSRGNRGFSGRRAHLDPSALPLTRDFAMQPARNPSAQELHSQFGRKPPLTQGQK